MKLVVDIGNSRMKWAWMRANALGDVQQILHRGENFSTILDAHWRGLARPDAIFIANVAGEDVRQGVIEWTRRNWMLVPHFVRARAEAAGVYNAYAEPERLGVDRWLGLIAARRLGHPVIIANCGTALTVDALADDGQHEGGVIMPGAHAMLLALTQNTQLPAVELKTEARIGLAQNTQDAMVSGVGYALSGAIERIYAEYAARWQVAPRLVVSGGDATWIASLLRRQVVEVEPNLVLEGLACLVPILSSSG